MPQSKKRRTGKSKRSHKGSSTAKPAGQGKQTGSKTTTVIWVIIAALVLGGVIYFFMRGGKNIGKEVITATGLKYIEQVEGTGATAQAGKTIKVHYTGTLENGTKFDSSRDPGKKPYEFVLGTGTVIKGWDEGLVGMKVGGKRKLIVPSKLGYGVDGRPPSIPGNSTLLFDVELVDVK